MEPRGPFHIVLTVGMNPVPCLVAAYRLCRHYHSLNREWPCITALHSSDSEDEARRVLDALVGRIKAETGDDPSRRFTLDPGKVEDPYRPDSILAEVREVISKHRRNARTFHLHYTGGTKAMGVHAAEELSRLRDVSDLPPYQLEVSYLDPQKHRLMLRDGKLPEAPDDERESWDLTINKVAALHGFHLRSEPLHTSFSSLAGEISGLLPVVGSELVRWLDDYRSQYARRDRFLDPGVSHLPNCAISWAPIKNPKWPAITEALKKLFGGAQLWDGDHSSGWTLNFPKFRDATTIAKLNRFLTSQILEMGAANHLKSALVERLKRTGDRIEHSVKLSMPKLERQYEPEIDVVAIMGYQLLAVSCSMSTDRDELKKKAFEILHRARQMGGDGARAILLCALLNTPESRDCEQLQIDIQDDLGVTKTPIVVWGIDEVKYLTEAFETYLHEELGLQGCETTPATV